MSATGDPMHFMFGYRVGFSGTADPMALFSIGTNSTWRPPPSWIISNGHISATAHSRSTYIARGHICDSTAFLFCMPLYRVRYSCQRITRDQSSTIECHALIVKAIAR